MSGAPGRRAIAVLGVGGVGGLVAARTGALCIGTARTVEAIRRHGLRLAHDGATTVVRVDADERLEQPVGVLVVAVKAYDLDDALARIEPSDLDHAVVLPLLNGLEHVGRIRARIDRSRAPSGVVAAGSIGAVEAVASEPGLVTQRTPGGVPRIAAASDVLGREALDRALSPLHVPGLELVLGEGERDVLWEKAARLAVVAAAAIARGRPVGELRRNPATRDAMRAALDEAVAVAAADGVELAASGQWAIIEGLAPDLVPSAARDAAAGRQTELDAITGSVVRAGARLGVPTPALASLLADAERALG